MTNARPAIAVLFACLLSTIGPAAVRAQKSTPDSVKRKPVASRTSSAPVVTHVENTVRPVSFSGKCPATLHWTARLTVRNPPAKVQYEWVRSDGATSQAKEIDIRGTEGIIGGESWQLGGDKDHMVVWERLHVISPNVVNSRNASVKVTCR